VKVGDSATVVCRGGNVEVTVEGIETPGSEIKEAGIGQQVGLRLRGISREQPATGDWVLGHSNN
jgi:selenocysteine-specific translation elongation factor